MRTKSIAKRKLYDFLKESKPGEDYNFQAPVPVHRAEDFVQRMRVALSRLREQVRQQDRIPKSFKVLYIKSEAVDQQNCIITLRKSVSKDDVSTDLDEVFNELAGGRIIQS